MNEDLYVANADGSYPTYLTNNEVWGSSPAWFPDSEKIAFVGDGEIYTINADDTNLTQLTDNAPVGGNLVISPDGKQIAFLGRAAGDSGVEGQPCFDLYVIDADGSGLTNLSDKVTCSNKARGSLVTVNSSNRFLFSPDSKQIAFISSRTSNGWEWTVDLYVVNVDGTGLTRLTNTKAGEFIVTWVWK